MINCCSQKTFLSLSNGRIDFEAEFFRFYNNVSESFIGFMKNNFIRLHWFQIGIVCIDFFLATDELLSSNKILSVFHSICDEDELKSIWKIWLLSHMPDYQYFVITLFVIREHTFESSILVCLLFHYINKQTLWLYGQWNSKYLCFAVFLFSWSRCPDILCYLLQLSPLDYKKVLFNETKAKINSIRHESGHQ